MIAPNSSRVGYNSTPLNWKTCQIGIQSLVATRRKGSFTLIWYKKKRKRDQKEWEIQPLGDFTECFLSLEHILWRFEGLLQLFYTKESWLGFFLFGSMRTHGQSYVHMVNTNVCKLAYAHARSHIDSNSFSYFGLWFLHQGFSRDSYDLEDYSRHTQTQIFKHKWKEKSKTIPMSCKISTCTR